MQNNFIAYIDGSRHFKSNSSGWAFIIYKNAKVFHEDFGEVPIRFEHQYEQFAFAQLMKFVMSVGIKDIQIYTDALNLKNTIDKQGSWQPEVLKYEPQLAFREINLKIDWIPTKQNGVADKLSRKYLDKYFFEEKHLFKENLKKGLVNGNIKHPKINYYYDTRMLHSLSTNGKMKERKFLFAVKHESIIIEVGEFKNAEKDRMKIVRVMKVNEKKYDVLEVQEAQTNYLLQVIALAEKWMDSNKRILLCLNLEDDNFDQLTGFKKSTQSAEFHDKFDMLLENMVELVLSDKLLWKDNSVRIVKEKKKVVVDLKTKIMNIQKRIKDKTDTSLVGKLIAFEMCNFIETNKRIPEDMEKAQIISNIRKNFEDDFSTNV